MANLAEDGNHTSIPELVCRTRLYGFHLKIFVASLNIPLSITAFVGNILIIFALQKASSLHPPSKFLFSCLASTDICVGLLSQPLFVSFVMSSDDSKSCRYLKILLKTTGAIFGEVSVLTLTAIAVDRLLALLLKLRYRHVVSLRRVQVVVFAFWLFSAITAVTSIYSSRYTYGMACINLLLCITTSTFSYTKIYHTLRRHRKQIQQQVHEREPNGGDPPLNIVRYRKTVSSALWVQLTLLACYLPFGVVAVVYAISGFRTPSLDFALDVAASIVWLNSTLNPFLYCWKVREVREAVKDRFGKFCCLSS